MKDLSMQFWNLTNFFSLSHSEVKLLMKTYEKNYDQGSILKFRSSVDEIKLTEAHVKGLSKIVL